MNELSNKISNLLITHRSFIRPILEKVSKVKVDEYPKINDLKNLGDKFDDFLKELEKNSAKDQSLTECYELLKEYKDYLLPLVVKTKHKETKKVSIRNPKTQDIFKGGASEISKHLVKRFKEKEVGVIKKIYELCKQADIYPIEFDRLFYLIGSGRYEGLGNLEKQDFKPKSLKNNVYGGKKRIDTYLNFFNSFKQSIEKNFDSSAFEEMKLWVINHYNEGLIEKKLHISDIDNFITHSYSPSLLEDEFPSENALIDHLICNRYASGSPSKQININITVEALQRYFQLEEDISLTEMKERASIFIQEKEYSSLSVKNENGNDANLSKDIELLFHAFNFIKKKCNGSMEDFYCKISMKDLEEYRNLESYENSFINLVKEISNWPHYGNALSANFIKDYQLTRELKGLPKEEWKYKFAAYTTKPDLHLINFTRFLSNKSHLDQFLEYRLTS